jgi:hypothetical protein
VGVTEYSCGFLKTFRQLKQACWLNVGMTGEVA